MIRFNRNRFVSNTCIHCPRCRTELALAHQVVCDNCGLQLKVQGDYILAEYMPATENNRLKKVMRSQRITDLKED